MKVLEINDVHKTYHDTEVAVEAIRGVTLSFEKGEFAVIVGPSGSGKTTLLNLLGGLDQPTGGEIL
ncbi:MAG: ATP-binding cassette domain-containing protein, partial [Bacteroidales bacterium]|nr:ATP-binding cassette domain-containing protein [Bacteroidales bacterium]